MPSAGTSYELSVPEGTTWSELINSGTDGMYQINDSTAIKIMGSAVQITYGSVEETILDGSWMGPSVKPDDVIDDGNTYYGDGGEV